MISAVRRGVSPAGRAAGTDRTRQTHAKDAKQEVASMAKGSEALSAYAAPPVTGPASAARQEAGCIRPMASLRRSEADLGRNERLIERPIACGGRKN